MIIPKVLKNFNLFVEGVGYAGLVEELTLPKLTLKMADLHNGGMDAPVDLEMGMDKLECSFTVSEYNPEVIKRFGLRKGAQASLVMRGGLDAEDGVVPVAVHLVGAWKDLDMGSWKPGEKAPLSVNVTLRYYKLTMASEELIEVDVANMVRRIDGEDQLQDMRKAIGME